MPRAKIIRTYVKPVPRKLDTRRVYRGVNGENIELQANEAGTEIQWRVVGEVGWNTLIDVEDLIAIKEDVSNKVVAIDSESTDDEYPSAKLLFDQLALGELLANKVVAVDAQSTDDEYPSAKLLFDQLALGELLVNKVTAVDAQSTDDEYPSAKLLFDQLALKEDELTFGIADTNKVKIDSATVANGEYAKFTASGLESRSVAEVLSDIGAQASGSYVVATVTPPASATATGVVGQIIINGGFIYTCVATNTWERAVLVTATWE